MLTRLKAHVQSIIAREAGFLHDKGVTPNQISAIGIGLALLASFFYFIWKLHPAFLILAPTLFLLSGFFDAVDGTVARLYGKETIFGGFLDSMLDRYSDACILVSIIASGLCDVMWGSMAIVGSLIVSYTRARAEASGVRIETVGIMERAERVLLLSVASFVSFFWVEVLNWSVIALALLTNLTVLQRVIHFHNASKQTSRLATSST